jgi:hypothetical protein
MRIFVKVKTNCKTEKIETPDDKSFVVAQSNIKMISGRASKIKVFDV